MYVFGEVQQQLKGGVLAAMTKRICNLFHVFFLFNTRFVSKDLRIFLGVNLKGFGNGKDAQKLSVRIFWGQ